MWFLVLVVGGMEYVYWLGCRVCVVGVYGDFVFEFFV